LQLHATATVYRDANRQRPDPSTIELPPASRLATTKISNINARLRQKQEQQLRVNTGEDLAVLTGG